MTSRPPINHYPTPPEFNRFADVVMQFAEATDGLLKGELSQPFNIGSEALRDCAANLDHPGTESKQTLLTLATQQVAVGLEQCDLLLGIAAAVRADRVTLAPFPLARTCAVIAAKAWYVLTAGSRQERLRRYLNEELAALYGASFPPGDEHEKVVKDAVKFRADRTQDYLAVGATAGLTPVFRKKPRLWDAPHLVDPDEDEPAAPPSETQLMSDLYGESDLRMDALAGGPYSLLSAATHGRFRSVKLVGYSPVGPSVGGVSNAAIVVTLEVTAQSTWYAALATRMYLCALARYAAVQEAVVLDKLGKPIADWWDIAHPLTQ